MELDQNKIEALLQRTKQKGGEKALKTLLRESETAEKAGNPAKRESSSEDEGDSRMHEPRNNDWANCGFRANVFSAIKPTSSVLKNHSRTSRPT